MVNLLFRDKQGRIHTGQELIDLAIAKKRRELIREEQARKEKAEEEARIKNGTYFDYELDKIII